MPSSDQSAADALWLAHRYVPATDAIQFRPVPREQRSRVPFLTDEYLGNDPRTREIARPDAMATAGGTGALHYIAHSAFCGSTMLAHALDVPGTCSSLSEPVILNDLVGFRRRGGDLARVEAVARAAVGLMARTWPGEGAVVVKPSNIVNPLLPALLALAPDSRAILLACGLDDFLVSVAKKGLWCRLWARELLRGLLSDGYVQLGFSAEDLFLQSDLQVAAVGWLAQQQAFARLLDADGERLRSLRAEDLRVRPEAAVHAALAHFGLDPATAERSVGAFSRDSKTGGDFTAERFASEHAQVLAAHGDEIAKVATWARAVAETFAIPLELPAPLL